jgi:hypothetical protein
MLRRFINGSLEKFDQNVLCSGSAIAMSIGVLLDYIATVLVEFRGRKYIANEID